MKCCYHFVLNLETNTTMFSHTTYKYNPSLPLEQIPFSKVVSFDIHSPLSTFKAVYCLIPMCSMNESSLGE